MSGLGCERGSGWLTPVAARWQALLGAMRVLRPGGYCALASGSMGCSIPGLQSLTNMGLGCEPLFLL